MNQDTHRCAICRAEFASSAELVRHEKESHTRKDRDSLSDNSTGARESKPRQGREFSRRNVE